jgi:hypothetical protein
VCLRATAASPLARTGGGTRPLAGEELASKRLASGIKGLIMLLRPSFRKGTAELTYRNRDMGSKLVRLDCKSGGSWELCSRIWESRDSNFNGVTGYSSRIFICYFLHLLKPVVDITLSTPRPVLQTGTCLLLITKFPPNFTVCKNLWLVQRL